MSQNYTQSQSSQPGSSKTAVVAPLPADSTPSMSGILLEPLNQLQQLSQSLFLSLGPPQARGPPTPEISAFLECDATLAMALQLAHRHQVKQRRIETLKRDVLSMNARWREICEELEKGRCELEGMVEEGEKRIKAIADAKTASIPYPELLAYAQSLSAFTSAPPNMPDLNIPGQPPPPLFFPPFPNEEKMRRGRLNAEAPMGHLGETHSVGRPTAPSPKARDLNTAPGANPYRQDHRPRQNTTFDFDLDLDLNPDL